MTDTLIPLFLLQRTTLPKCKDLLKQLLPMTLNIRCGQVVRDFQMEAITKDGFKGNDSLIS